MGSAQLACLAYLIAQPCPAPPAADSYGWLARPAYDLSFDPRPPFQPYTPQAGDLILSTTRSVPATLRYLLALTWRPTHAGVVVRTPDGGFGVLEAGGGGEHTTRVTPLADRFAREADRAIWVRTLRAPLTPEQEAELTEFAGVVSGRPYATRRQVAQATPFRSRGPLRTFALGRPKGVRDSYICSEVVIEALVAVGVMDAGTARPVATYPRDMFFDRSPNLYLRRHPPVADRWEPPALWTADPAGGPARAGGPTFGPLLTGEHFSPDALPARP